MPAMNIKQQLRGNFFVVAKHAKLGVIEAQQPAHDISEQGLREWMQHCASSSTSIRTSDPFIVERPVESISQHEQFRQCFVGQGKTFVLEGRLGVGKTVIMHGLIAKVFQAREDAAQLQTSSIPGVRSWSFSTTCSRASSKRPLLALCSCLLCFPSFLQETKRKRKRESTIQDIAMHAAYSSRSDLKPTDSPGNTWKGVIVARIFFKGNEQSQHSLEAILMLLLSQLVEQVPGSIQHVRTLHARNLDVKTASLNIQIADTICSVLGANSKACIFLDALDECGDCLPEFLETMKYIQAKSKVGLVMTERTGNTNWKYYFEDAFDCTVRANNHDVNEYMDRRLEDIRKRDKEKRGWITDVKLRERVKEIIINASGDMFLLVRLNIDFALNARNTRDLDSDLRVIEKRSPFDCPTEERYQALILKEAFQRNLERAIGQPKHNPQDGWRDREITKLAIGFIRDAVRPLSSLELGGALAMRFDPDKSYLSHIEWSGIKQRSLDLIQEDEHGIVHLLHESLYRYLESADGLQKIPKQDGELGRRCVAYLNLECCPLQWSADKAALDDLLRNWPFLNYAARYWSKHLTAFEEQENLSITQSAHQGTAFHATADLFLRDAARVEASFQIAMLQDAVLQPVDRKTISAFSSLTEQDWRIYLIKTEQNEYFGSLQPNGTHGVHAACLFGLDSLLAGFSERESDSILQERCSRGRYPLHYAVEGDHVSVVRSLILNGVDLNCQDNDGKTPLMLGAALGKCESVKCLLSLGENKINVNAQTKSADADIHEHAQGLRRRGSEVHSRDYDILPEGERTALHYAAQNGHTELLKLLLQVPTIAIDIPDAIGRTSLHLAAKLGLTHIVELLFKAGADLARKVKYPPEQKLDRDREEDMTSAGFTALHFAAKYGNTSTARFLLNVRPSLANKRSYTGETPLQVAAHCGEVEIAEALLQVGRAVGNSFMENSEAAMFVTPSVEKESVLSVSQMRQGIDINARNNSNRTALHIAALRGNSRMVKLLLQHPEVQINVPDRRGHLPVSYAVVSGSVETFMVLWEREDVRRGLRFGRGTELLRHAATNKKTHPEVLKILIEHACWDANDTHEEGCAGEILFTRGTFSTTCSRGSQIYVAEQEDLHVENLVVETMDESQKRHLRGNATWTRSLPIQSMP